MRRIICIVSQKGGVGKSTTCHALGSILARRGRNTLMIDTDPQASLSAAAGVGDVAGRSMAEVLSGTLGLAEIVKELAPGLWIAPSDIAMANTELLLVGELGRENTLKSALEAASGFDYILIDTPPSLGLLTINALVAAGECLIPARPEYLGLRALVLLMDTLAKVRKKLNPGLHTLGILPTHYRRNTKHHQEVIEAWKAAGLPLLPVCIVETIKAAEAPIAAQSIVDYAPGSSIAEAYTELAELIENAKTSGT